MVQSSRYFLALIVVHSLSRVRLFKTPWAVARQASLFSSTFQSLLKFMSIEWVMLSNHPLNPLLLLPSISQFKKNKTKQKNTYQQVLKCFVLYIKPMKYSTTKTKDVFPCYYLPLYPSHTVPIRNKYMVF